MQTTRFHRFECLKARRRTHFGWVRPELYLTAMFAVAVAVGPTVAASAAPPTEVNTCGQVFSGGGFLSGDLDCRGFTTPGFMSVKIQGGTLDLRGFTLTSAVIAVECTKSCKVVSDPPGGIITSDGSRTITAVAGIKLWISDTIINDGIVVSSNTSGKIKVIDSTITGLVSTSAYGALDAPKVTLVRSVVTGNAVPGVFAGRVKLIDSEVSSNAGEGVDVGGGNVVAKRSMIFGNSLDGIVTPKRVRLTDSSITGNGGAGMDLLIFGKAKVLRSDISGNALQGVAGLSQRIVVRESTITNNGAEGIRQEGFGVVKLTDSTITGNALDGVAQVNSEPTKCQLKLQGTTMVTGNGTDPSCGVSRTCADLTSCDSPEVDPASMCNTSYDVNSGFPGVSWGVCALD